MATLAVLFAVIAVTQGVPFPGLLDVFNRVKSLQGPSINIGNINGGSGGSWSSTYNDRRMSVENYGSGTSIGPFFGKQNLGVDDSDIVGPYEGQRLVSWFGDVYKVKMFRYKQNRQCTTKISIEGNGVKDSFKESCTNPDREIINQGDVVVVGAPSDDFCIFGEKPNKLVIIRKGNCVFRTYTTTTPQQFNMYPAQCTAVKKEIAYIAKVVEEYKKKHNEFEKQIQKQMNEFSKKMDDWSNSFNQVMDSYSRRMGAISNEMSNLPYQQVQQKIQELNGVRDEMYRARDQKYRERDGLYRFRDQVFAEQNQGRARLQQELRNNIQNRKTSGR